MRSQQSENLVGRCALVCGLLVLAFVIGCDLNGVSEDERVSLFISDLVNTRYGNMRSHVHPNVEGRDLMGSTYWETAFGDGPFSEQSRTGSGNTRRVTVLDAGTQRTLEFRLLESGNNWYIDRLTIVEGSVQIVPVNDDFI